MVVVVVVMVELHWKKPFRPTKVKSKFVFLASLAVQRQFFPALHTPHRSTLMVSVSEINRSVWSKIPDVGEFRFMTEHLEAIVPHCEGRA